MRYFDYSTNLSADTCAILARDRENESIQEYNTNNLYYTDCKSIKQLENFSSEHFGGSFFNGYGNPNSCVIDIDSKMKQMDKMRGPDRRQLSTRTFQGVPNFNKGVPVPNTEYFLINGQDTSVYRECDRLTERNYDRFTPLTPCMQSFIENEAEVIPMLNRIGSDSRELLRASRRCK